MNEADRLTTLEVCHVLDTPPEPDFDGLTRLASIVARCPIAFISLIDSERQWFKSRVGLEVTATPRDTAFCAHAILVPNEMLVVEDARVDERFADNPQVTGYPGIVFYAGVPLKVGSDEHAVGALCVVDHIPRQLTGQQQEALLTVAHQVEVLLERRQREASLERALEQSERERRQFETTLDNLLEGVIVLTRERRVVSWNASASRMLGWPDATQSSGLVLEPLHAIRTDGHVVADDEWPSAVALRTGQPVNGELLGVRQGSDRRWVVVNARPIAGALSGDGPSVIVSFTDVTELRRSEDRRRNAERAIDNIFTASLDLLCTVDTATGRVTRVNPRWEQLLGFTETDLVGRHFTILVHPEDRARSIEAAQRLFVDGQVVAFENRLRTQHGEYLAFEWNAVHAQAQGLIYASGRDVTKQREYQTSLTGAMQAAEAATEAKSAFLATMSHEIRTPLAGVIGVLNLLIDTPLDKMQQEYAEAARSSADALLIVLNDVLDFSKIEAGRLTIEQVAFDPSAVIGDSLALFDLPARQKGIDLESHLDIPAGIALEGDPGRIRQVLLNLVSNAVKFTEEGGVMVLAHLEPDGSRHADLVVTVHDSGSGIEPDVQRRLFQSFMQADSGTARRHGGSGLGLAISRRLCDLMGGRIDVSSVAGHGSTFTMRVRCGLRRVTETPASQASERLTFTGDALVAEDDAVSAMVATKLLAKLGLRVDHVSSGRAALDALARRRYDIVLMDCQMPDMDGLEATRRVRSTALADARLPIVALTANVFAEDRARCLEAGMDDFLTKPLTTGALAAVLRRWLVDTEAPASVTSSLGRAGTRRVPPS